MNKAMNEYENGSIEVAAKLAKEAALEVPEINDYKVISDYYQAIYLVSSDNYENALPLMESVSSFYPEDINIRYLTLNMKIATSFDEKNYSDMYNSTMELAELFPEDPMIILSHASGAACMYVDTNKEKYREESEALISSALLLSNDDDHDLLGEYIQRIRNRLESKEIIDSDEYYRRFPNEDKEI